MYIINSGLCHSESFTWFCCDFFGTAVREANRENQSIHPSVSLFGIINVETARFHNSEGPSLPVSPVCHGNGSQWLYLTPVFISIYAKV